jgi:hypothetical protein
VLAVGMSAIATDGCFAWVPVSRSTQDLRIGYVVFPSCRAGRHGNLKHRPLVAITKELGCWSMG